MFLTLWKGRTSLAIFVKIVDISWN